MLRFLSIILFCTIGMTVSTWGQYTGGSYGGSAKLQISTTNCPISIDNSVLIFTGGNGSGTAKLQISTSGCPVSTNESILIYKGGNGAGTAKLSIATSSCPTFTDESVLIFKGGNAGGTSVLGIASTTCAVPEMMNIFMGGSSSSNAASAITATVSNNTSGPYISTISDTTIVNGNCITLNTSGSGATSYSWSPSTGLSNSSIQNPVASPSVTTTYTVTAQGSSTGCRNIAKVTINVLGNNSITTLTYPSKVCNSITTLQEPIITGITSGTFSASSSGLKINTSSGLINPSTSTVGVYNVTYTYGTCNNTITTSIEITNDCTTNLGALEYPNIFKGGVESNYSPKSILIQGACTPNYDYTQLIYAGGNASTLAPKSLLIQGACTPNLDFTKMIYAGGVESSYTPKSILLQGVCSVPVGDNFYLGGAGVGYGNGSLTPSTNVITGTAVAATADVTICPGAPTTLGATGATNYTWTPATGLNNSLLANPIASPTTTTTYTVVGTGVGVGCINTAKVTVNVIQDAFTTVSYGAYNFDEADMNLKKVNFINGPLNGTFSFTPAGLSFNSADGSFTPGLSTSQPYTINYNYTKGICSYTYAVNINVTKLPPSISYTTPSIFYINYSNVVLTPTNSGGNADIFEALDPLPTGLTLNTVTGVITGTPTQLVNNASVRIRAANYKRDGSINWSDITTMSISVKKPIITLAVSSISSLNTTYGTPSTNTSLIVLGDNIIDFINVVAPAGFETSVQQGSGFADVTKMYPTADHIINQPLYVRLKKTTTVGNHSGNIVLTSTSADAMAVTASTSYVAPATLTITARYFQKFYGSTVRLGTGSKYFTTTGLVNDETIGSVTITPAGGTASTDAVGYYAITPSAATGGTFSTSNYNINYVPGQFQVVYSLYNFAMTGNNSNWVGGKIPVPLIQELTAVGNNFTTATITGKIPTSFVNIDEYGVCYGTSINPTTSNSKVISNTVTPGIFNFSITGLTAATKYFARAYVIVGNKIFYSQNLRFKTLGVGDEYQGGYIGYIFGPSDHGYIAGEVHGFIIAKSNLSGLYAWDNGTNILTGATNSAIGYAQTNTEIIVNAQGAGSYSAKLCYDLTVDGYSDWWLPTIYEVSKMSANRAYFPSFALSEYASSTELNLQKASKFNWLGNQIWNDDGKFRPLTVRPIRYF